MAVNRLDKHLAFICVKQTGLRVKDRIQLIDVTVMNGLKIQLYRGH